QSNSEHSRHWFFRGKLIVDGREVPETLMKIVKATYEANRNNSVIAFSDNSSSIRGYDITTIVPEIPGYPSPFKEVKRRHDIIFTAETHNFPSGVAPFPGAETGTGGRIRDVQATGIGGLVLAGTAAYCVGNLRIPGYELPWEDAAFVYPSNLASPLQIEVEASNGASDYGNKFGEPLIQGFTRSFGVRLPDGERREWLKPIMFSGGIGQMDSRHRSKSEPQKGMLVVKVGGPAYRIGMGGGAASSMIQGENIAELDFNAVQRGDAEMEQKMNRVIRACVELGEKNPIVSIHDQGAGGNCNVVKEIVHPAGAKIEIRKILVGDETLSVLEIWGAEYQEQNALLLKPEQAPLFENLCTREKVPVAFIGQVTGDGYIVLHDASDGSTPVNLELSKVLGDMPQKTFTLDRRKSALKPLELPPDLTVRKALERVLRLLSVGSKRFLTNKVDRSVTGLIARQQCAGPLQLTVSDVAVIAQSHFGTTGAACSIGEQPVKELLDPAAMA
ncbi:MAG: phosphoribosylformylglycinamidine synthase, partial [Nitrospirae bacterium]|nr:phosphoribosylformylglycinamidine synthase [Nitrospirota bacterium]